MKSSKGLTVIEVLMAAMLVIFGLIAIGYTFPRSLQIVETSQDIMVATEIATNTLELLNQPFPHITDALRNGSILTGLMNIYELGPDMIPNSADDQTQPRIARYEKFQRAVTVTILPANGTYSDRAVVEVLVQWQDIQQRSRNFTVSATIDLEKAALI